MNAVIKNDMLFMTEEAREHVRKLLSQRGYGKGIRLSVKTLGCSGSAYDVEFMDEPQQGDHVFDFDGTFQVAVDANSFDVIKGTEIGFVNEGLDHRLVFNNPNVKDLCGCGESFSV